MRRKSEIKLAKYRFEDDRRATLSVGIFNLIIAVFIVLGMFPKIQFDIRAVLCICTGITFLLLYKYYDWKSSITNWTIAILYLVLFILEFIHLGTPGNIIEFNYNRISKGVMFQMMIGILPYLYMIVKIGIILPLVNIIYSSQKVNRLSL